jgi:hypothetical protein
LGIRILGFRVQEFKGSKYQRSEVQWFRQQLKEILCDAEGQEMAARGQNFFKP